MSIDINNIDINNFDKLGDENIVYKNIGYYDSSVDDTRTTYNEPANMNLKNNSLIIGVVIYALYLFIGSYCTKNVGIKDYEIVDDIKVLQKNICQNFFELIFSFEYPIITIIAYIIVFIYIISMVYLWGIFDFIIDYFYQQYINFINNDANIFTNFMNYDYTQGTVKLYKCTIDSIVDSETIDSIVNSETISNLLKKKKAKYIKI